MFQKSLHSYLEDGREYVQAMMDRIQIDVDLPHVLLAFLVGFALGSFVTAFFRKKNAPGVSKSKLDRLAREYDRAASRAERQRRLNEYRTRDGRTIDEVERDARRRL